MTDTPEQACGAGACPGVYPVRCGLGSCPDVFPQDNGDILVIGRIATAEEVSASGGNVGEGEVALVIAESFFDKLPVVAELRARIAKLEGEESFPEVQSFSPEALEKMREYARNADELNAQRVVDLGCQAGAVPEEAAHRPSGSSNDCCGDAEERAHPDDPTIKQVVRSLVFTAQSQDDPRAQAVRAINFLSSRIAELEEALFKIAFDPNVSDLNGDPQNWSCTIAYLALGGKIKDGVRHHSRADLEKQSQRPDEEPCKGDMASQPVGQNA